MNITHDPIVDESNDPAVTTNLMNNNIINTGNDDYHNDDSSEDDSSEDDSSEDDNKNDILENNEKIKECIKNIKDVKNINDLKKIVKNCGISLPKIKNIKDRHIQNIKNLLKEYIPYPLPYQYNFYQKIYKKQEFYENKYIIYETDEKNEQEVDEQKILCDPTKFQLLKHQIILRNYLDIDTPYNSLLIFHGMGTGKNMFCNNNC